MLSLGIWSSMRFNAVTVLIPSEYIWQCICLTWHSTDALNEGTVCAMYHDIHGQKYMDNIHM